MPIPNMDDNPDRKPLFIPLKREFFEAFQGHSKTIEYRPAGPRWNRTTCTPGRKVILSCGYGTSRRLHGVITQFAVISRRDVARTVILPFNGKPDQRIACIRIAID